MAASTHSSRRAARPGIGDAVLVLLGAQVLSILWVGVVLGLTHPDGLPDPIPATLQLLLNIGLWLGYGLGSVLMARAGGRDPRPVLGIAIRPLDSLAAPLGVALQLGVLPVLYWLILQLVDGDPSADAKELLEAVDTPAAALLFTLAVVVVAPLVEELYFRGLLLGAVRGRYGDVVGVVVSALVFALVHRQLLPLPGLFLFGVVAALLVIRTGRLGPAWLLHAGFNAATVALLGFG